MVNVAQCVWMITIITANVHANIKNVKSKEDNINLEPSVATGCVDGSTPMPWYVSAV